jgi:predicted nucleotidyltransferase
MLDKNKAREIAHVYASKILGEYTVNKVVLFGSCVNGTPHEWSDIDIAVIINDFNGNWYNDEVELYRLREDISFDIEPHLLDEKNDPSGFCEHVLKTGEIIYEKPSERNI